EREGHDAPRRLGGVAVAPVPRAKVDPNFENPFGEPVRSESRAAEMFGAAQEKDGPVLNAVGLLGRNLARQAFAHLVFRELFARRWVWSPADRPRGRAPGASPRPSRSESRCAR